MIERKLRKPVLKEDPAIIIALFGSTHRGRVVYELFEKELYETFPDSRLLWAFTSEIIRQKTGHPGILQALSEAEAEGYRKAVVQPIHIFPGTEYQILYDLCKTFPGMRVIVGETLLHRWHYLDHVIEIVSTDFLPPQEGINILVAHGTPLTADPANILYIGLDHLLKTRYRNVHLCSVEGFPDRDTVFSDIAERIPHEKRSKFRVRLIPFMFVAGKHAEEDLMGREESYATVLGRMGFDVEIATTEHNGNNYPKGLGFYREVRDLFVERLKKTVELMGFY